MNRSNLLVPGSDAHKATMACRNSDRRRLRGTDPAIRGMTDFQRNPPLTTVEDCDLDHALDDMFRLGVRAFLVVRAVTVVGLITAEDIRHARRTGATCVHQVMTAAADMPAIDWQTLQDSTIGDLMEIFEGASVHHLVVLESESAQRACVRGLVHRSRLERRLQVSDSAL